ncbi:MAG: hypothetical protein J7500_08735 [Sphingomonas sp.]|uniref:hypothetical protein n=1 Tax=Sphingomonas sp. TaxID=28214 RepID=UPI001B271377|nr:hypothetical protein [Sphingomonas sp.]MBO9622785.1 hypothetical protein [Sphingomonas sp.]
MKSWSATAAVALLCVSCASPEAFGQLSGANRAETAIGKPNLYPDLGAVRFKADDETLKVLERIARDAGWADIRKEASDTLLVLAPRPYDEGRFRALIDGLDAISNVDAANPCHFTMQLLGPDGKSVDADGKPVSQN